MKRKFNKKSKKLSLRKMVLEFLTDLAEAYSHPLETHYQEARRLRQEFNRQFFDPDLKKPWKFNQAVRELRRSKYLETVKKNNQLFVKLTQKGVLSILLNKLEQTKPDPKSWDSKWRMIIWDIPESSNKERNKLRRFVKNLGFCQIQKSVFLSPYALPNEAVAYLQTMDLWKFLRFFRIDKVDDDRWLKKHFGLE